MTKRISPWYSLGYNIYSLIKKNGAGEYKVSLNVMASAVPENARIGFLIRTNEENSFSKYYSSGDYFCRLDVKENLTANQWVLLEGTFEVTEEDISASSGNFNMMIDLLEYAENQALYFDNAVVKKNDKFVSKLSETKLLVGQDTKITTNKPASEVTFSSGNGARATVSSDGTVTAISPGLVAIYAKYGGETKVLSLKIETPTVETEGIVSGNCYYLKSNSGREQSKNSPEILPVYMSVDGNGNLSRNQIDAEDEMLFRFEYIEAGLYKISRKSDGRKILDGVELNIIENSADRWYVIKRDEGYLLMHPGDYRPLIMTGLYNAPEMVSVASEEATWTIKRGQEEFAGTQLYGASSTTYGTSADDATCDHGYRGSATVIADRFIKDMTGGLFGNSSREALFNRKNSEATKDDLRSKADYNIGKDNIDDVDFMLFVGHGFDSSLHYDYDALGRSHSDNPLYHELYDNAFTFAHEEAKFGKESSRTKWFAAFSCNYLNQGTYSYSELKQKMEGANIVLGFSTTCYLNEPEIKEFADELKKGEKIIDAWTDTAYEQSRFMNKTTYASALFVEEAYNDTIFEYYHDAGTYREEDIKLINILVAVGN